MSGKRLSLHIMKVLMQKHRVIKRKSALCRGARANKGKN